jgi:uncharacterized protein (DUF2236 family)
VFAHVTIFHAFLRNFEALAFRRGRPPGRLPATERDRYFRELVPFAELMGAPRSRVPDSASAVADYYASIATDYGELPGYAAVEPAVRRASLSPRGRELALLPFGVAFGVSNLLALAIVPRAVRRLLGVPVRLDQALDVALATARPAFAPLAVNSVGDRLAGAVVGPDGRALIRAARTTMARERRAPAARRREPVRAAAA